MLDYLDGTHLDHITVHTDIAEEDVMPVTHLFRAYPDMPDVERYCLDACHGHVLDVGAGAGSHALYLQEKGLQVTAMDISEGAIQCMEKRGIKDVLHADFYAYGGQQFDTLLLMMNGIGFTGNMEGLHRFLEHAKILLKPGGQILFDSSDLIYLFPEGVNHYIFPETYYGIVATQMAYKEHLSDWFEWLFIDEDTLQTMLDGTGWKMEILGYGPHYDYAVRLVLES